MSTSRRTTSIQTLLDRPEFQTNHRAGNRRVITHQLEEDVKSHRKVAARSKTEPNDQIGPVREWENATGLASAMWDRVINRLQAVGVATHRLVRQELVFALPNVNNSPQELAIFDALYHRPMTVTNAELGKILSLELCGPTTGLSAIGSHFYFRSWTFTEDELRMLIDDLSIKYDEVMEWKRQLDLFAPKKPDLDKDLEHESAINLNDPTTLPSTLHDVQNINSHPTILSFQKQGTKYFTIRYVGTCDSPRNPYDRLTEDFERRTAGLLMEFQQAVERILPAVADAAEVYLIKDASLHLDPELRIHMANQDQREQFFIEFFDHATLLNRQHGGYYANYVPYQHDVDAFHDLNLDFYFRLHNNAVGTPASMHSGVVDHFRSIQNYANGDAATGTSRHYFTDGLRDVMARQAQPPLYRGKAVLMVVIGKDTTLDNYLKEVSFFDGKSHSGSITRDLLRKLATLEAEGNEAGHSWSSQAFNTQLYPFVDLWYWLWHKAGARQAADFLREYMALVRPLIAAAFSRPVNGYTRANFVHEHGVRMEGFIDVVGEPTIRYYEQAGGGALWDEDTAFINIAHWHPGADKYTSYQQEVRRVLDLTWQMTQLVGSLAMDYIDHLVEKGSPLPSRLKICERVVEMFQACKADPKHQAFFASFEEAKKTMKTKLSKQRKMGSDDVRPLLDQQGRLRMAVLGQAEHEPNSKERRAQVLTYWNKNIPDLHLIIPHDEDRQEDWIQQFMPLATGQYFFMEVARKLPADDDYVKHLVRTIQPEWKKDDSWMQGNDRKDAALLKCGFWFHKADKDVEKVRGIYGAYPDTYASAYDLQGRMIGVSTNGGIRVRWRRDDGVELTLMLKQKRAIPSAGDIRALRTLDFTEHGIDILNEEGVAYRTHFLSTNTYEKASVERNKLAGTEGGPQNLEMWKAVRLAHGHSLPNDLDSGSAKVWSIAPGVTGIAVNARQERPTQNRPPRQGDALYPLMHWLDERFPEGGVLRTILKARNPGSTEDLQDFVRFLKSHEWINHPHVQTFWLPKLDIIKPDSAMLEKNIRILRSTSKERTDKTINKKSAKETIIIVGAPGTASLDPFGPDAPRGVAPMAGQETKSAPTGKAKAASSKTAGKRKAQSGDDYGMAPPKKKVYGTDRDLDYEEEVEDEEAEEAAPTPPQRPRRRNARGASTAPTRRTNVFDEYEEEQDQGAGTAAPTPTPRLGRRNARGGTKAPGQPAEPGEEGVEEAKEEEEEEEEEDAPPPRRQKPKRVISSSEDEDGDSEMKY